MNSEGALDTSCGLLCENLIGTIIIYNMDIVGLDYDIYLYICAVLFNYYTSISDIRWTLFLLRTLLEVVNRANEELLSANGCSDSFSCKNTPWSLYFPPPALCTDNGVMVAWAGIEKMQAGIVDDFSEITGGGFEPIPRWPIGPAIPKEDEAIFRKRIKAKNPST